MQANDARGVAREVMNPTSEGERLARFVFYGAVLLLAVLAYRIVEPFLVEVGWAVVLAVCVAPAHARLSPRIGAARSAAVVTLMVLLLLVVPLLGVAGLLVRETSQVATYVDAHVADGGGPMGLFHVAWRPLHERFPFLPSEEKAVRRVSERLEGVAGLAASHAGSLVKETASFAFGLILTFTILFFMVRDGPEMIQGLGRALPFGRERNELLFVLIRDIVAASVTSTLVIAVIQGIVGGLAFALLGVPGPLLWGCLMAALALLPAVGAALVWVPAAIWLALSGSLVKGVMLVLVGVLVMGHVDNVVRPLMLSGTARMSTLVLILSLLGGVRAFGFIGIVLGPVVAAVLTAFVKAYVLSPEAEPETPVPQGGV